MRKLFTRLNLFKGEYSKFQLMNGLIFSSIFFCVICIVIYNLWIIVDLNSNYVYALSGQFKSMNFQDTFRESFFDYLLAHSMNNIVPLFVVMIILFFLGVYISGVLIRPFRLVSEYCDKVMLNGHSEYEPDWLSSYRLFTRFSELFFSQLNIKNIESGKQVGIYLPKYYSRIHKPVTDWIFIIHFTLVMILMSGIYCYTVIKFNDSLFDGLLDFVISYSKIDSPATIELLQYQNQLLYSMHYPIMIVSLIINFILAFYMYSKVSGASFAVFSTMRSFLKGNHSSRIHLIGYSVLRDYTRNMNKYFEFLENKIKASGKSSS